LLWGFLLDFDGLRRGAMIDVGPAGTTCRNEKDQYEQWQDMANRFCSHRLVLNGDSHDLFKKDIWIVALLPMVVSIANLLHKLKAVLMINLLFAGLMF
jgi:hypothetical protein